jgi:high-affinity K+ transport system ATPase subunit B
MLTNDVCTKVLTEKFAKQLRERLAELRRKKLRQLAITGQKTVNVTTSQIASLLGDGPEDP